MSSMFNASSDPPEDLEKGTVIEEDVELAMVDPCIAMCVKAALDVLIAVHSLFLIGIVMWMVKVCDHWWDPWPIFLVISPVMLWAFWMTPMVKDECVRKYATRHTLPCDSDISAKLLASNK